jgi:hypothetical protein
VTRGVAKIEAEESATGIEVDEEELPEDFPKTRAGEGEGEDKAVEEDCTEIKIEPEELLDGFVLSS